MKPTRRSIQCPSVRRGILAALCVLTILISTALAATYRRMSVEVREAPVRSSPSFLGKVLGTLPYASRVKVREEKGAWCKLTSKSTGLKGWTHKNSLSKKKILLNPGAEDTDAAASSDEIALAGKGFNEQVEKSYRSKHKKISFVWVDRMQKIDVSTEQMKAFLDKGKLVPPEEAAR